MEFNDVVNMLFSPTATGIALGSGSIWLLVFLARQVAAPMSRWPAPWGGIGRWVSGPSGGFWAGGILAACAAALKAASAGPMDGAAWASVVIAWGAAMGINSAAKRAPGLAQVERGRKRRAGLAAMLALGLTLTSTSAMASTSTVLNPRPTLAGVPSVGDILDVVPGVGITCRAGSCALAPHLWGSVALVDVAPGWTLGPVLGGAAILDGTGITGAVSLGVGLQLPWGSSVRLGLLVTADYYLPDALPAGWGASGSLGFFF